MKTNTAARPANPAPNFYAACYPNGMQHSPRTIRIFKGIATRSAWIAARITQDRSAPGYRCTLQAADITPSERAAIAAHLSALSA